MSSPLVSHSWNPWEAARVFLAACYGDMVGYSSRRKRILGTFWVKQRNFDTGGREITVLEAARTPHMRPAIFFHGAPGNAIDWRWFLKHAADQFQIAALDRPGFGPVDRLAPNLERDLPIYLDILRHYGGEHKPVLVGHSLGGGMAARLAADYPDLVSGLMLVGAGLDPAREKILPVQERFAGPPWSWLLPRTVRHANVELLQYAEFLKDLKPRLANIKCPVTVIHARNDRLVPYANVDYIKNNCTGAAALNIMELKSGGHFLNRTKPREILKALATL